MRATRLSLFRIHPLLLVLVLVVGACAAAPAVDLAAEEDAVRAVSMRWLELEKTRDAAGIAALFVADGTLYREDEEPVVGTAAIIAYLTKSYEESPAAVVDWTTDQVDMSASGDLATERGTWSVKNAGPDGTGTDGGRYIATLRKLNGEWKVLSDVSLSTTAEVPRP
jgi:uncharacterized protein (TIGR02246 family)